MLMHTVRDKSKLTFTCGEHEAVVKINMVSKGDSRCKWHITGAQGQPPLSSLYDLSFSLVLGDEAVVLNGRDKFTDIIFHIEMSNKVRVKLEK